MVKPQSTIKRGLANSARLLFVSLSLVGVSGCQALRPTSGAVPGEVVADTQLALPAAPGEWTRFDTDARRDYSGVELGDGSVLVCGGVNQNHVQSCNRLSFDGEGLQSQTLPLPEVRLYSTLTLVQPGRVLLAGGTDSNERAQGARLSLPFPWTNQQNVWGAPEGSAALPSPRADHTATLLDSSVVLIGGRADIQQVPSIDVRSADGGWTKVVPSTALATRTEHSATLLKSQPGEPARVLVLGGYSQAQGGYLSSGFIFSLPDKITPIPDMPEARKAHTATLLDDGSVLVAGGMGADNALLATAWRYYPEDGWASAKTIVPRKYHAAARLGADVIIAGGQSTVGGSLSTLPGRDDPSPNADTVQRYDPAKNEWSSGPNLRRGRSFFQIFSLDSTHLLAVGGATQSETLSSSEMFTATVLGARSNAANSCLSGYLADGVCCDKDCEGACHSCSDPTAPGICQLVSGPAPAQHACDRHVQCSAGLCPDNCDASHPCESGFFCGGDRTCHEVIPRGIACTTGGECADGRPCVDGVCCESTCSGSCEACNQPDRLGLCRPLPSGELPRAGHAPCADADPQCAGACDGRTTDRCAFPDPDLHRRCGDDAMCTPTGEFHSAGECNGGTCVVTIEQCGSYDCDRQGGCLNMCQSTTDCASGYHCNGGDCMHCDKDACAAQGYTCDDAGECRTTCERSADCAGGFYCHPVERRCVQAVPFPAAALPACGIGHGPVRHETWPLAVASLLAAAAARRARRADRCRAR
ncbi:MAG TPA: hypothetical protein VER12_19290 [Polyangiaceae bacterium]|nr:hypothetical protein [Polyangiaceae bacterium]